MTWLWVVAIRSTHLIETFFGVFSIEPALTCENVCASVWLCVCVIGWSTNAISLPFTYPILSFAIFFLSLRWMCSWNSWPSNPFSFWINWTFFTNIHHCGRMCRWYNATHTHTHTHLYIGVEWSRRTIANSRVIHCELGPIGPVRFVSFPSL